MSMITENTAISRVNVAGSSNINADGAINGGRGNAPMAGARGGGGGRVRCGYCKKCKEPKPARAHHCHVCNQCIVNVSPFPIGATSFDTFFMGPFRLGS